MGIILNLRMKFAVLALIGAVSSKIVIDIYDKKLERLTEDSMHRLENFGNENKGNFETIG